jgi:hypothetical protein
MTLYTFGLRYPDGELEEIDVQAAGYQEAKREATELAAADYLPGYTLVDLPAGGSGGLAITMSSE